MSRKCHNSIEPVFAQPYTALVVTALAVFLVFGQLLSIAHRWVEYPLFYQMNPDFTLRDWLQVYNPFRPSGYRPTAFNLYFQTVSKLFGWQNFPAYQWIAFLFQFLLGACTWLFVRKALDFDRTTAFFAGLMVSIHPVFFMLPVHLIHFDALYQIFLLLASIIWMSSKRFTILKAVAFLLLAFLALSAKEQAVALPAFLVWVLLYDRFTDTNKSWSLISLKTLGLLISMVFAAIIIATSIVYENGDNVTYRTVINLPVILKNALAGFFWIFRIHLFNAPTWPDVRANLYHPAGLLLGVTLLSLAAFYCKTAISSTKDRRSLWILTGLIGLFFLLPIYSGGRQWHFGIPAIGAMIMAARGFTIFLNSAHTPRFLAHWAPHAMLLMLVSCSVYELNRDQTRGKATTIILKQALENPPVASEELPANADIIYACGSNGAKWAFGNESLFKYVYQRRDLREHLVVRFSDIDETLLNDVSDMDNLHIFEFKPNEDPAWRDVSEMLVPILLRKVSEKSVAPIDSLDLRDSISSEFSKMNGWSEIEPLGRWTNGTTADLTLAITPAVGSNAVGIVKMAGYLNKNHPTMDVSLFCNGVLARKIALSYPKNSALDEYRFDIPKESLTGDTLTIQFLIDSPARPIDLGLGNDNRELGLFVQKVAVESE